MAWKTVGLLAAVLLMTPGVTTAQSSEPSRPTVMVRSYNNFGVPAEELQIARGLAERILRDAGIEVTWIACWFRDREPADASRRCRQPLDSSDLVLRLQAGQPAAGTKFVSMGFSLVGSGPNPAFLSTIFVDLVQSVARGAAIDPRQVLGLAIAHEIGHLLLNTNSHATTGLMRAGWSRAELRHNVSSDWRFLDTEAATMRAAIATRASGIGN